MNAGHQLNVGRLANGGSLHRFATRRTRLRWLRRAAFCSCALALLVLAAVWFTSAAQAQQEPTKVLCATQQGAIQLVGDTVQHNGFLQGLFHVNATHPNPHDRTKPVCQLEALRHIRYVDPKESVVSQVVSTNQATGASARADIRQILIVARWSTRKNGWYNVHEYGWTPEPPDQTPI